ncbi:MAG: TldD/PmbA family protein [Baekduiaceae bacterium]
MTDALELAERALAHTDGQALARVVAERSLSLRFARSAATQSTAIDDLDVEIMVLRDGHAGVAATNHVDDEGLRDAARRAADAAAVAAAHAAAAGPYPSPPPGTISEGLAGWDPATAALDPGEGAAAIEVAIREATRHDQEAFGIWSSGEVTHAIASSAGARLVDRVTDSYMKVITRDARERSGFAAATDMTVGAIDGAALARTAAAKVGPEEPVDLPPGTYTAVLDTEAVGELLSFTAGLAFDGLGYAEGRGALTGRLGEQVAAPAVTLLDDPRGPGTLLRTFDADGVAKRPVTLLAHGVAKGVVHDIRSAARAGGDAVSTGHAIAPGGSPEGPLASNLVLAAGDAADVAELCAPIERGIYVTRLWYTNTVREREALVTSMTRDGTFLIEDGRISRPVRDVRITDGLLRMLSAVEALGSRQRLVGHGEFYGRRFAHGVLCPAIRVADVRVTGGA